MAEEKGTLKSPFADAVVSASSGEPSGSVAQKDGASGLPPRTPSPNAVSEVIVTKE